MTRRAWLGMAAGVFLPTPTRGAPAADFVAL